VPGLRLFLREPGDLLLPEAGGPLPERRPLGRVQGRDAERLALGEQQQPLDLDVHAGAIEPGFGQVVAERRDDGRVAAVERTERLRGEAHQWLRPSFLTRGRKM